jgi:hypothetical protein
MTHDTLCLVVNETDLRSSPFERGSEGLLSLSENQVESTAHLPHNQSVLTKARSALRRAARAA